MKLHHLFILVALLSSGCSCNPENASPPLPDVASDHAKKLIEERRKDLDSVEATPESVANEQDLKEAMERSEFRDLTDEELHKELEARLKNWVIQYRSSCDTAIYNEFKKIKKDMLFQAWLLENQYGSWKVINEQLKEARDSCRQKQ